MVFLESDNFYLRNISLDDCNETYLSWMNDIFGITYDSSGNRTLHVYGSIAATREVAAWT